MEYFVDNQNVKMMRLIVYKCQVLNHVMIDRTVLVNDMAKVQKLSNYLNIVLFTQFWQIYYLPASIID